MKVLMYGWEYPPRISGGLGVACHAIVTELMKKDQEVFMVLPYELDQPPQQERVEFISCHLAEKSFVKLFERIAAKKTGIFRVASLLSPYLNEKSYQAALITLFGKLEPRVQKEAFLQKKIQGFLARHIGTNLKITGRYGVDLLAEVWRYGELAGALASGIPHDVIHAHDWLTILAGIRAKSISGKPLFFHVHALETDRSGIEHVNQKIYETEKYGLEQADCILAVSSYTKNNIIKYYGIPEAKIRVVSNGIYPMSVTAASLFQSLPVCPKMVLFVGRITHQKGPYFFIEMARKILKQQSDVQFVMAGSGDLLQEMIVRVAELRIGKNFHFTGFLNADLIKRLYEMASVYVMPSVSEPFGLTCLEALSCNVPVVVSYQSGVLENLTNVFAVDFWDTDRMAFKVLALLEDQTLRAEMLKAARADLQKLTWDRAADKIINAYHINAHRECGGVKQ